MEQLAEAILTSAYVPVIIDADGLNAIAAHPYLTSYYTENIVITPHLGEMARLTGQTVAQIQENLPVLCLGVCLPLRHYLCPEGRSHCGGWA